MRVYQVTFVQSYIVSFHRISLSHKTCLTNLTTIPITETLSKALSNGEWIKVMKVEVDALEKNRTSELVELPNGKKKTNGFINRYLH